MREMGCMNTQTGEKNTQNTGHSVTCYYCMLLVTCIASGEVVSDDDAEQPDGWAGDV